MIEALGERHEATELYVATTTRTIKSMINDHSTTLPPPSPVWYMSHRTSLSACFFVLESFICPEDTTTKNISPLTNHTLHIRP
jgi:hypothetical protein